MRMRKLILSKLLLLFQCLALTITTAAKDETCLGPRTPDEIATLIYNETTLSSLRTRPSVARVLSINPDSNPAFAPPDIIKLGINIFEVKSLDQKKNEFEVLILLKQRWNDFRLMYGNNGNNGNNGNSTETEGTYCYDTDSDYMERFSMEEFDNIWKPDIIIANLVDEPNTLSSAFWISPAGDVEYYQRQLMKLSCKFDFKDLPVDTQSCKIVIRASSDGDGDGDGGDSADYGFSYYEPPISASSEVAGSVEWDMIPKNVLSVENTAVFKLHFQRIPDYYHNFVIIPVILMVVLGWASFFIARGAVPARITMSTISFLTISNFLGAQLKNLPRISANEAWLLQFMLMSMIFTFYAVLEYIICNYLFRVEKRTDEVRKQAVERKKNYVAKQMEKQNCVRVTSLNPLNTLNDASVFSNGSDLKDDIAVSITKDDMLAIGLFKIDRLIIRHDGNMRIKDQHVEIFSRYAYPITYAVLCGIFAAAMRRDSTTN